MKYSKGRKKFRGLKDKIYYFKIEEIDKILYENNQYKICLVGDEVYMTTYDFISLYPSRHVEDITEEYIGRFIGKEEYEENINQFIDAFESYKTYTNL